MTRRIRTIGCFLEYEGKFLILHRIPARSQPNRWGLVAGLVENNKSDIQTILEEIKEETGYEAKEHELEFLGEWEFVFPDIIVDFPTYRLKLSKPIKVKLYPDEHDAFRWVTAEEFYNMPDVVHGCHKLLELVGYVKTNSTSKYFQHYYSSNAYLQTRGTETVMSISSINIHCTSIRGNDLCLSSRYHTNSAHPTSTFRQRIEATPDIVHGCHKLLELVDYI